MLLPKHTLPMKANLAAERGFSLVEVLVAVAVIGILASVTVPLVTGVPDAAKKEKLEQDVVVVNNAIDAYLAAGGATDQLTADNVLAALKSRVYGGMPAEMMGPQGPFLDPVVTTNATDFAWSALYTTDPRPRFFVAQDTAGVVFGKGPATAVGGVAERPDEARPSWLWSYAEATPPPEREAFTPLAVDLGTSSTNVPLVGVTLGPPLVTPASMTTNLWRFPLQIVMTNTNPAGSSRIYYKVGAGNYSLHDGSPFNLDPGASLVAVSVSLDPSRYYNSTEVTNVYGVVPLPLAVRIQAPSSVTYAEAGGVLQGVAQLSPAQATVLLEDAANPIGGAPDNLLVSETGNDKFIPPSYLRDANFIVKYTMDGTDPLVSPSAQTGPAFNGFYSPVPISLALASWGTNASLPLRAVAISARPDLFISSGSVSNSVAAARTALDPPVVLPTNQVVTFAVTVTMSNPATGPTGSSIRYTTNNTQPNLTNGATYSSPFSLSSFGVNENKTLRATRTMSGNLTNWFDQSPDAVRVYTGPAFAGSGIPSGALVGSATLNSTFNGSVTIAYPTNGAVPNITYNQNAVINGSLYVPGTPRVAQNSPFIPQWTPANDLQFSNRIYGLVEGQSPNPRVVDLTGPVSPTNYVITFNNNSYITGKIFRRSERYSLTPLNVATFPAKTSSASLSLSGPVATPLSASNVANVTLNTTSVGSVTLLPGTYGNMTANNNSKFVLGNAADPETPVVYNFDSLTLNSGGDVVIVGRVILNLRNGFNLSNGAIFGNSANPDWLQINVWNANVNVASGSSVYGRIFAPNNTIAFNNGSILNGSVSARTLELNSTSVVFSLSPANAPGP
jgi:prepilin-type N-terminal cleavage/methylation domain-containing protein